MEKVKFIDLGISRYYDTWLFQKQLFNVINNNRYYHENKLSKEIRNNYNYLIFTEHYNVYTMGKGGKKEHILFDDDFLKKKI